MSDLNDDHNQGDGMNFQLLKALLGDGVSARLGRLALKGRSAVETPAYFANTSRGVVPHLTPDVLSRHTSVNGSYFALEDFVERSLRDLNRRAPILAAPSGPLDSLRTFTATSPASITVLGARRQPPVLTPVGNSSSSIGIFTSTGFQPLTKEAYHDAVKALQPDIVIPLADLSNNTAAPPNAKRALRMVERTEIWLGDFLSADLSPGTGSEQSTVAVFAPLPPVSYTTQLEYLDKLSDDFLGEISGLAVYDTSILPDLEENYPQLTGLPRLSFDAAATPQQILWQISLGMDILIVPFINRVSDAGIALTFSFPSSATPAASTPSATSALPGLRPLGIDMSTPEHKTALTPLVQGCRCYTCTHHHRAYVRHLLSVREMLAWTLLQIHNHHVVGEFFADIRRALASAAETTAAAVAVAADGSDENAFEAGCRRFSEMYEAELPAGAAQRPRARGYNFKSEGFDEPRNKAAWSKYDGGGDGAGIVADGAVEGPVELRVDDFGVSSDPEDGAAELPPTAAPGDSARLGKREEV